MHCRPDLQSLSNNQLKLLTDFSLLYRNKRFEYITQSDAATGYSKFPELNLIQELTSAVLAMHVEAKGGSALEE